MVNWPTLLNSALVCGMVLSVVLTAIMIISAAIAPDMWVGDYPPDVKERFGPMSPRAARIRPFVAVFVFGAAFAVPIIGLYLLSLNVGPIGVLPALAFSVIVLLVFNVFDLLVLDWLLFCTIQPRVMVLPGTEGMAGYRDYRFHFIGFLKGSMFCTAGGLVLASIWSVVQMLLT
jgi:hypothetical protein